MAVYLLSGLQSLSLKKGALRYVAVKSWMSKLSFLRAVKPWEVC